MRLVHAIHDFLPRHQAGSEIYAFELGRELSRRHDVTVLCADFDPSRPHGHVSWRVHQGLPVVEVVNNWVCESFAETYRPPLVASHIGHVLRALQPEVLHVHNLLNLTFDLPAMARGQGSRVVATLHDYTLVCASGGQRVHRAEQHRCDEIDPVRCARCFRESPFYTQASYAKVSAGAPGSVFRVAQQVVRAFPSLAARLAGAARQATGFAVSAADIEARLNAARDVFEHVDLFVAPSPSIAAQYADLGIERSKIRVSDYGFVPLTPVPRPRNGRRVRIGYVGTLVWHKGVHILIDAVRDLPADRYELKIFGDPRVFPDYSSDLRARAAGLPVRFMNGFTRDQTAEIYQQLDVLVVPSLWLENSPLVIHEAYMAGVPIVGSRIGGIADLVTEGRSGSLYEPTSASQLTAALRALIDRPDRLDEFRRSLPRVKTIEEDAGEWEAAYRDLIDPVRLAALARGKPHTEGGN